MTDRKRSTILAAALLVTVAACGGGADPAPTDPPPAGGPTSPGSSDSAATQDPAVTPTDAGTGGASGVCSLVTAAELDSIFAVVGHTTLVIPGPPDTCDIQLDSAPAAAFVYTPQGGRQIFDILAAGPDAQSIGGIGDAAFYSADTLLLLVAKGQGMLSIAVFDDGQSPEARLELMKEIGKIAAGRM